MHNMNYPQILPLLPNLSQHFSRPVNDDLVGNNLSCKVAVHNSAMRMLPCAMAAASGTAINKSMPQWALQSQGVLIFTTSRKTQNSPWNLGAEKGVVLKRCRRNVK